MSFLPSPEPRSEQWLAQRLRGIARHETEVAEGHAEKAMALAFALLAAQAIVELPEVATPHHLVQQEPSILLIHGRNHLVLGQGKHLVQHIHHRPGKLPQAQASEGVLIHSTLLVQHYIIVVEQLSQPDALREQMAIEMRENVDNVERRSWGVDLAPAIGQRHTVGALLVHHLSEPRLHPDVVQGVEHI